MDTEEFLKNWVHDNLGRKVKYGSYYVKTFDKNEYLCHYNPDSQGMPYLIGVKMRMPGGDYILLLDSRNGKFIANHCDKEDPRLHMFSADFNLINQKKSDVTRIKILEHKVVQQLTTGIPIYMVLFDIDGSRWYTEFSTLFTDAVSFLNLSDTPATEQWHTELRGVKGHPTTIEDARALTLPDVFRQPNIHLTTKLLFVPGEPDVVLPDSVWMLARWVPHPVGFQIADNLMRYRDQVEHWVMADTPASVKKRITKEYSEDMAQRVLLFRDKMEKHKEAKAKIHYHMFKPSENLSNLGVESDPKHRWLDNDGHLWVRGKIELSIRMSTYDYRMHNTKADLGDVWHKVLTRGIKI